MMDLFDILKQEHVKLQGVLDKLLVAEEAPERDKLLTQVRDLLVPHSRAEEAVLYNFMREMEDTKELVSHSYREHMKAETLLRGLQVSESVHLTWKAGVEMLKKDLTHHIAEEEGKIFPAAKAILPEEDAVQMGKAFEQLKEQIGGGIISSQMELVANLMPQKFRNKFITSLKLAQIPDKQAS